MVIFNSYAMVRCNGAIRLYQNIYRSMWVKPLGGPAGEKWSQVVSLLANEHMAPLGKRNIASDRVPIESVSVDVFIFPMSLWFDTMTSHEFWVNYTKSLS